MPIEEFDDLEDLFQKIRRDQQAAHSRVQDWQRQIKPRDYFRRYSPHGFYIYGEVLEEPEPRNPGLENHRLCRAYSLACPRGEMGDIDVSTVEKILTEEEFEEARNRGWK